jgi:hypothetical protein
LGVNFADNCLSSIEGTRKPGPRPLTVRQSESYEIATDANVLTNNWRYRARLTGLRFGGRPPFLLGGGYIRMSPNRGGQPKRPLVAEHSLAFSHM